jgi:hypothetical protein
LVLIQRVKKGKYAYIFYVYIYSTYIANGNKIYAQGIDMNKNLVKLLNTVKIVQKSGSKINTKNLMDSNDKNRKISLFIMPYDATC